MGRASRSKAERRELEAHRMGQVATGTRRCLVCNKTDGGYTSVEHVFPESIGNQDLVLPRGVLCDRCNNGPMSRLDQAMLDFLMVGAQRIFMGLPSKSTGEVPDLRLMGGVMRRVEPNTIRIEGVGAERMLQEVGTRPDGGIDLKLTFKGGRRLTPRYGAELSSWLLKVALECAWIDHGDRALRREFDNVRACVRNEPREGFLAFARRGAPSASSSVTYWLEEDERGQLVFPVVANIYGIEFGTTALFGAPADAFPPEDVTTVAFAPADFRRPKAS